MASKKKSLLQSETVCVFTQNPIVNVYVFSYFGSSITSLMTSTDVRVVRNSFSHKR